MVIALGQTVTVINRSGKVVSNSKHLVNIYKEAKAAYRERKAELTSVRKVELAEERQARQALQDFSFDDDRRSNASSRRSSRSHHQPRRSKSDRRASRPPVERGISDSFYENDDGRSRRHGPSRLRFEIDDPDSRPNHRNEIMRRHSDGPLDYPRSRSRRHSYDDSKIDMDLAYGELPPPLPESRRDDGAEVRKKMSALTRVLDEANCLQHSVMATVESLQKQPDQLAAVALTLAEISNLLGKMGPSALGTLKSAFPAVMALLASPQFMIAAGVGVGITVVALGGYKVVKKIKHQKMEQALNGMEPMPVQHDDNELKEMPEDVDLSAIEHWRRGIAEIQANSVGTSVDGEFITPGAERRLIEEGVLREGDARSSRPGGKDKHKHKHSGSKSAKSAKSSKSVKSSKTTRTQQSSSSRGQRSRRDSGSSYGGSYTSSYSGERVRVRPKKKEPSGLRMVFV